MNGLRGGRWVLFALAACGSDDEMHGDGTDDDGPPADACDAAEYQYPDLKNLTDCDAIDVEFGIALTDMSGKPLPADVEPGVQWTVVAEIRNLTNTDIAVRSPDCVVKNVGFFFEDQWAVGVFDCFAPTEVEVPASGVATSEPFDLVPLVTEGGEQLGGMIVYWYLDDADIGHTCWVCADDVTVR